MAIQIRSNKAFTGDAENLPQVPLLDLFPGAPLAFSLYRRLNSAYSGSLFRVRRSSDDAEADIGLSGNVVDTTSLLSFVGASSGFVKKIYNQSGTGNDATSYASANELKVVSAGVLVQQNSRLVGYSDSSNYGAYRLNETLDANVAAQYLMKVEAAIAQTAQSYSLGYYNSSGNFNMDTNDSSGQKKLRLTKANAALVIASADGSVPLNQLYVASALSKASLNALYKNGSLLVSNGTTEAFSGNIGAILSGFTASVPDSAYAGYFAELVYYNTDQSANRASIEAQTKTRYGI